MERKCLLNNGSPYWYKIFRQDDKGNIKTLFHGVNGSRIIPTGQWIKADVRTVHDGSSGTPYQSGWHVMRSVHECLMYLKNFKDVATGKRIAKCSISGTVWPKEHSRADVFLAEWLFVVEVL